MAGQRLVLYMCLLLTITVTSSENQEDEEDQVVKDLPANIDENVKEQLLNDEKLYQKQREQEVDEDIRANNGKIDPKQAAAEMMTKEKEKESEEEGEEDKKKSLVDVAAAPNLGFIHAFVAALSVIIVSEIGDKTFFIAAIMSMKYSRLIVFGGALSALAVMTFLSVLLGSLTMFIPRWVTFYVCTLLLAVFGIKMLYEAWHMSPDEGKEEFEQVSEELKKKENALSGDLEEGGLSTRPPLHRRFKLLACLTPVFIQTFYLTFLAEWGDRSQLTTIILSAREDPVGVTLGGTFGHALCTLLAVICGKIISETISVRTVTFIGGIVFLTFVLTAFLHDPDADNEIAI